MRLSVAHAENRSRWTIRRRIVVLMELRPLRVDVESDVRRCLEIVEAVRLVDSPWEHPETYASAAGHLRHGWDGDLPDWYLVEADGDAVGLANYFVSTWDNQHLAWMSVRIHPEHRRSGHGSAVVDRMLERARAEGRRTLGIDGWDSPAVAAFGARHGFEVASRGVVRRQVLAEVDWALVEALHKEAADHASPYTLERWLDLSNPVQLGQLSDIIGAINDAPNDDLDFEDEVFPPERIGRYEQAQAAQGHLLHRVVARHRETGRLAGNTVVVVFQERPTLGEQHDTSVLREHRGHRLGLLLKTEMLLWLREAQPRLATFDTGNAATNDHMIGINEQLGYHVMATELELQRRV
jgi:GNAT superfamily N-acetyltransferase